MMRGTVSLPSRLQESLRQVTVAPDRHRAVVAGRTVEASEPREFRRLLAEALYDVLHAGQQLSDGALPFRIRDEEFERVLHDATPCKQRVTHATVCPQPAQGSGYPAHLLLVELDGVRVWVPKERVTGGGPWSPGDRVSLLMAAARPALSPGFFLVDGSQPRRWGRGGLRVYVNITDWRRAAPVWSRVLTYLERHGYPYRAKIISAKPLYPRRDAIVVYLSQEHEHVAHGIADCLHGMAGIGPQTSVFASTIRPGVAVAWEPADPRPGMRGLSFGQHRASVLALALHDAAKGTAALEDAIIKRFTEASIDPSNPARNRITAPA